MDIARAFITRSRYYLQTEYRTKLRAAVKALPPGALWWRANEQSNSVGNLLMHLAGNVQQWIVSGVGKTARPRDRAGEFGTREGDDADTLLARLEAVLDEADAVLARLSAEDLGTRRTIQDRDLTVLEAVYHVVEHFGQHVGQIIYIAKMHAPGSLHFYDDAGGMARPLWPSLVAPRATPERETV